ncbi:MAG: HAD hydrolase-like protein, partial [Bacilli bacterium]
KSQTNQTVNLALFDFDGTLADTSNSMIETMQEVISKLKLPNKKNEEIKKLIGPPLPIMINQLFPEISCEKQEDLFLGHRKKYAEKGWKKVELYFGINELLQDLSKKQYGISIISLKPEEYIKKICKKLEITNYFDFIIGVDLSSAPITKKELLIKKVLHLYTIPQESVVMIGDTESDIKAANICGIDSIMVTYGYGEIKNQHILPTYIVTSVEELRKELLNGT